MTEQVVRGDQQLDSGYFYAPYVPLTQTPTINLDGIAERARYIITRYGRRLLEEGRVRCWINRPRRPLDEANWRQEGF